MSRRRSKHNPVFSSNNYILNLCCHLINWFSLVIHLHDFHVYSSLLYCITRNVPLIRLYCHIFFEWITSTWKNHIKFIGLYFTRFHSYSAFSLSSLHLLSVSSILTSISLFQPVYLSFLSPSPPTLFIFVLHRPLSLLTALSHYSAVFHVLSRVCLSVGTIPVVKCSVSPLLHLSSIESVLPNHSTSYDVKPSNKHRNHIHLIDIVSNAMNIDSLPFRLMKTSILPHK